jgi:4-amino-4-deoxy-L-arabinose transferase-like glycosyltransferase
VGAEPVRAPLLLIAACLLLFFTGLGSVPFYTRGEPREALVAREMIRTGEWLVPSRPDGELTRKPPVFYWASATSLSLLPDRPELAARLPSALLGTAGVLLTWAVVRAAFGAAVAFPAALMLATSLEWIRAATVARVDMALVAGLTLLFGAWLVALARERPRLGPALFVMAAAGAVVATLAKGPVALVLPALAAGVLVAIRRDLGLLRRLAVIPVLVLGGAIAGLWYGAAFAKHGWAFFDIVARENWLRYVDSEDAGTGHSHGFIYLPLVGLIGLLPWTPLLPLAGTRLADPSSRTPGVAFAASWVVVTLVFFSLAAAKRSVYLLPLFPALVVLLALGVEEPPRSGRLAWLARTSSALYAPMFALLATGAVALAFGGDVVALIRPWLKPRDAQNTTAIVSVAAPVAPQLLVLAVLALVAAVLVVRARRAGDWRRLVMIVALLTTAWTAAIGVWLRPPLGRAASLQPFMARVDGIVPPDAALYAFFTPDAGLRFYAPRRLEPWRATSHGPAYLLLWDDERKRWRDEHGKPLEPLAVSEARQASRGPLNLVLVPADATLRATPRAR